MKKLLSALLVLTLCLGLCVQALAADSSYFEKNGLTVSQTTPSTLTYTYLMYNPDNTSQYRLRDGQFSVLQCTTEPSDEEGYNVVTLKVQAHLQSLYIKDTGEDMYYAYWDNAVYDYYTGRAFSYKDSSGDDGYSYAMSLPINGKTVTIYGTKKVEWDDSGWYYDDSGNGYKDWICTKTQTFKVPDYYDGLVFALVPMVDVLEDLDTSTLDGSERYVMDELTSERLAGTQFFRFGKATATVGGFSDVSVSSYYADPVSWAVDNSITTGTTTTTFSPNSTCTRAQIITFLYRAAGSPKVSATVTVTDVSSDKYYYSAVRWAAENGMFSGTEFKPNDPCTRAMTVDFMWKYAGSPTSSADTPFTDVSADDTAAVSWALENGVTTGTTTTTFSPDNTCTRAQIVTFLYRAFA